MPEQQMKREQRLARELALYRYSRALERGDIETIEAILLAASQDGDLEEMIYALHALDHSAGQPHVLVAPDYQAKQLPDEQASGGDLLSLAGGQGQRQKARSRLQMLAAVLVVAVLIATSTLLFTSRLVSPGTAKRTGTPTTTQAAQGMVIVLLANGDVQAYHGVTGRLIWTYATKRNAAPGGYNHALVVQNHVVYVAVGTSISALDEQSGQPIWQKQLPTQPLNSSPNESQMIVDAGIIYLSAEDEPQSVAYAVRTSDGQLLWQVNSTDVNPPLLTASGGTAYVAIQNAAMTQTTIEARRGSDGYELWRDQSPGVVSFATVANSTLYVYAFPGAVPSGADSKLDKQLLALNVRTGAVIWSQDVSYGNYTTPISYAQGVLVIEDGDRLCAHSSGNGALLWCKQPPTLEPAASSSVSLADYLVGPDTLYAAYLLMKTTPLSTPQIASTCTPHQTCGNRSPAPGLFTGSVQLSIQIEALNLQNGQPQWTSKPIAAPNDLFTRPVSLDLVRLREGTLLVAGGTPLVVALGTGNGRVLWQIAASAQQPAVVQIVASI